MKTLLDKCKEESNNDDSESKEIIVAVLRGTYNTQPRPQGLLLVQNGGSEKPLAKAAEILQESWSNLSRDS